MRGFIAYSLRIRSDIGVPGGLDAPRAAEAADIAIELAPPRAGPADPALRREGDEICFDAPGVAAYRCLAERIRVAPCPGADAADVEAVLVATALPVSLWMRGGFVLHAAAARLAGHESAIAIAGASGSGKSTILAQLIDAGGSVLADDTVLLAAGDEAVQGSGLAGGYFRARDERAVRHFHPVPRERALERAPVAAILVLSRGDPGTLTRLAPVEAVAHLLANRHRPYAPALLGRHAATLADSTLIAGSTPIYAWRRPAGALELAAWEWDALARCAAGKGTGYDGQALAAQ